MRADMVHIVDVTGMPLPLTRLSELLRPRMGVPKSARDVAGLLQPKRTALMKHATKVRSEWSRSIGSK